jgi:hypothetical protein
MMLLLSPLFVLFFSNNIPFPFFLGEDTEINGTVISYHNESTSPLQNANLVLIIKQEKNHDDIHHLQLNMDQSSFPIHFSMKNLAEIKHNGNYLLTLLIFGKPHRLLWESALVQQYLKVNQINLITFIVHDVCK